MSVFFLFDTGKELMLWFSLLYLPSFFIFLLLIWSWWLQEEEEKEEEEQARLKESVKEQKDVALEEMVSATAKEAEERDKAKSLDKQEQLCELSRALGVLASASVLF